MPKHNKLNDRALPEPCSPFSQMSIGKSVSTNPLMGVSKGQVFTISAPAGSGLLAEVDYVNHTVSIKTTPRTIQVRVAQGIKVKQTQEGYEFRVPRGRNVIPVFSPLVAQIGYFISPIPPSSTTSPSGKPEDE